MTRALLLALYKKPDGMVPKAAIQNANEVRMVKLLYFGSPETKYAVGIAISKGFSEVERSNDRLMELTIISADGTIHCFTAYLPKTG